MKETTVEDYLVKVAAEHGYRAEKIDVRGKRYRPDRVLTHPWRPAIYVETKAPGRRPSPGQVREHKRLRLMGYRVYVIDSKEGVNQLAEAL